MIDSRLPCMLQTCLGLGRSGEREGVAVGVRETGGGALGEEGVTKERRIWPGLIRPGKFGQANSARQIWPGKFGQANSARRIRPGEFGQANLARQIWPGEFGQANLARQNCPVGSEVDSARPAAPFAHGRLARRGAARERADKKPGGLRGRRRARRYQIPNYTATPSDHQYYTKLL